MKRFLQVLVATWWPLLPPLFLLLIVFAASAVAGFLAAVLISVLVLAGGALFASALGHRLRRISAQLEAPEAAPDPEAR